MEIESDADFGDVGAAKAKIEQLKQELLNTKAERQEYLDGWQRCKADSVNARKEAIAHADRIAARSKESFIEDLIPVLDGFDMAAGSASWQNVDAQWRSGIDHIRNQLIDVLHTNGVVRFGTVGEKVDHAMHEIMDERDEAGAEPETVVRVLRSGYKVGDRIIRPAQVVIRK